MDIGDALGDMLRILIILAIFPTLISSITSIAGVSLGGFESVFNVITSILPLLMVVQLIGSLVGDRDSFGLGEILNILVLFSIFPQILSAFSGLGVPTEFMDIINAILPLLLMVKLIETFTKVIK